MLEKYRKNKTFSLMWQKKMKENGEKNHDIFSIWKDLKIEDSERNL